MTLKTVARDKPGDDDPGLIPGSSPGTRMTAEGMMVEDADDGGRTGMTAWDRFPGPGLDHVSPEECANNLKSSGWDAVQNNRL